MTTHDMLRMVGGTIKITLDESVPERWILTWARGTGNPNRVYEAPTFAEVEALFYSAAEIYWNTTSP